MRHNVDLRQLKLVLTRNECLRVRLELFEESYLTRPAEGQQRWWVDAFFGVTETDPDWKSDRRKFGQTCLTRGFPKSAGKESF